MFPTSLAGKRIDADTHFNPRVELRSLSDMLPRRIAPQVADMLDREAERVLDPRGVRSRLRGAPSKLPEMGDPHRDPDVRADVVNTLGFDMQVLIPDGPYGNTHGAGPYTQPAPLEVRLALCQLFNNATADAQRKYPEKFIGTIIVPFDDLTDAEAEVRRAVDELGLRVVVLPFNWIGKNFDEYELYPFWNCIEELQVTVFCHGIVQGCGGAIGDHQPRYPAAFAERMRRLHLGTYMGFGMEYIMAAGALTLGGVLDEFPGLRFCFFEAGASWLPYAMYASDRSFLIEPQCARSATLPSELMKRHFLTAIEPMESVGQLVDMLGSENFLFGTDFPHPEFEVFHSANRVVEDNESGAKAIESRGDLSAAAKEDILGGNVARFLTR